MKTPPRFIAASPPDLSGLAAVSGAELRHMRAVMRLRPGAALVLIDGGGEERAGELVRYEKDRAVVRVDAMRTPVRPHRVILAAAIVKGPRMDLLVEKAAELGATELWPVVSARSVARASGLQRIERWRRLAAAAAKQSLSSQPMIVREPVDFAHLIGSAARDTLAIVCSMGAPPLGPLIRKRRPGAVLIACGPEGGFDAGEIARASDAGFVAAGLGPKRLRSETAALAALAVTAAALDELAQGD
ncbi:MAG: RsmE family RNA methyltransferase [Burkholderiales bacterium]